MQARVAIAILMVAVLFYVYSLYSTQKEAFTYAEAVTEPSEPSAPPSLPAPAPPAPALPSPPAPSATPIVTASHSTREMPRDPTDTQYESAQIPQRLRHPENSFSPGYVNDETDVTQASGVAGKAMLVTEHAEQTFGPELVQNGGEFMGGIMANDDSWNVSYSSI
jgi:hypothetical protein